MLVLHGDLCKGTGVPGRQGRRQESGMMYLRWIQPSSRSARGAFMPTCRNGVSGSVITSSPWLHQHRHAFGFILEQHLTCELAGGAKVKLQGQEQSRVILLWRYWEFKS